MKRNLFGNPRNWTLGQLISFFGLVFLLSTSSPESAQVAGEISPNSEPSMPGRDSTSLKEVIRKGGIPDIITSPSTLGEVHFPHKRHVEELGFDCHECHHETRAARLSFPHPDYFDDFWIDCKVCHHEVDTPMSPRDCAHCHHYPRTIADETLSPKVVIHKDCWRCHEIGEGAAASRECKFCHTGQASEPTYH